MFNGFFNNIILNILSVHQNFNDESDINVYIYVDTFTYQLLTEVHFKGSSIPTSQIPLTRVSNYFEVNTSMLSTPYCDNKIFWTVV